MYVTIECVPRDYHFHPDRYEFQRILSCGCVIRTSVSKSSRPPNTKGNILCTSEGKQHGTQTVISIDVVKKTAPIEVERTPLVDATLVRMQLQHMAVNGWTCPMISTAISDSGAMKIHYKWLADIRRGDTKRIRKDYAETVYEMFKSLRDVVRTDGSYARLTAKKNGWKLL